MRGFSYLNTEHFWAVLTIAIILWGLFLWKEWQQRWSVRFFTKALISLIAIASLAVIVFKPMVYSVVDKTGIILTEGATKKILKNVYDSVKKQDQRPVVIDYKNKKELHTKLKGISKVLVLGNGIPTYDLYQLDSLPMEFRRGEVPSGIVEMNFKEEVQIGDSLEIKGKYMSPVKGHKLLLVGPAGDKLDSVSFQEAEKEVFNLKAMTKTAGNFAYRLEEMDTLGKIIKSNTLPIKIEKQRGLKILIWNAYPSFETKYLKNYLAEMENELVVRTQVTRGEYKTEILNTENLSFNGISEEGLKPFDLLMMDATTFSALSNSQRAILKKMIAEEGLGLLLQSSAQTPETFKDFSGLTFLPTNDRSVTMDKLELEIQSNYIVPNENIIEIDRIKDRVISGYIRVGKGRIGTTVIKNTFELQLEGKLEYYKKLWSDIVESIAKRESRHVNWETDNSFPLIDEPYYFSVQTSEELPSINHNGDRVPMQRDVFVQNRWRGKTFPRKLGWNTMIMEGDSSTAFNFFVFDTAHWKSLKAPQTIQQNKLRASKNIEVRKKDKIQKPVNIIWFYLLFLGCMAYLWLEPKMK
ncbi:hypothetical protein HX109_14395 [Galbibacter sp. BG1]|uniref:hypothetical protein n=1 Tax=Galbibacter sp. BG1 TaxID=1170699 RepID=UPI0015BC2043|nr:hypothetical protein [Galbibacter sp. BG1]QLE02691.1 hypothetical protein HX109_14395 [Galbibacter sp. BG1]